MTSWSLLLAKMCSRWPMSRWAWPTCCWERTWGSTTSDTREYISSSDWMMHFIRLIENHNPASFTLHVRVRVVLLMTDIMSCTTFVRTTKHISRHGQTFRFFPKESRQAKFLEGCFCRAESAQPLIVKVMNKLLTSHEQVPTVVIIRLETGKTTNKLWISNEQVMNKLWTTL